MKTARLPRLKRSPTSLDIEEVRLIGDLRIMHSKVDELHNLVSNLKRRHNFATIHRCADQPLLNEDIVRLDDIYTWFVALKELGKNKKAM